MTKTASSELGAGASDPAAGPENSSRQAIRASGLHVCTSCRAPGAPREPRGGRPGFKLYARIVMSGCSENLAVRAELFVIAASDPGRAANSDPLSRKPTLRDFDANAQPGDGAQRCVPRPQRPVQGESVATGPSDPPSLFCHLSPAGPLSRCRTPSGPERTTS